jgi:hypothetical protein
LSIISKTNSDELGIGERPAALEELLRHANLKCTMDTYVQAVTDEKREAQNKVVKMLLPGVRRAVIR